MSFVWKAEKPLRTPEMVARQIHAVSLERGLDEFATVLALMCVAQESGFWCPWNMRTPDSKLFSYDSESDDNRSVGYYQQQPGPKGEPWWGSTRDMMTLQTATDNFLDRLSDDYHQAEGNPAKATEFISNVQRPRRDLRGAYAKHMDSSWQLLRRALAEPLPLPAPTPVPVPTPEPLSVRPQFTEVEMFGNGWGERRRAATNFFIHTEENDSSAEALARYCDGSNDVSYHYTVRDRIVCDVVDTDKYSWSVLDANVFSINLCFAGSWAGWSRDEWLTHKIDIEIAAFLAVQDCRKYGIPFDVIAPPYGAARPGISDHKYVTEVLRVGTHTDVGDNFPWDVFTLFIAKYANIAYKEPPMAGSAQRSLSIYRTSDDGIGTQEDVVRQNNAMIHEGRVELLARLGLPYELELVKKLAAGELPEQDEGARARAAHLLGVYEASK